MQTFSKTYHLPFAPETVYAHWIANSTVIAPAAAMEIDARVGGTYKLIMPGGFSMVGTFSRVEPNAALTYSWNWEGDDEVTEVAVTFAAEDDGTRLDITHDGFTSQTSYDNHASGWDSYVNGFIDHVAARS